MPSTMSKHKNQLMHLRQIDSSQSSSIFICPKISHNSMLLGKLKRPHCSPSLESLFHYIGKFSFVAELFRIVKCLSFTQIQYIAYIMKYSLLLIIIILITRSITYHLPRYICKTHFGVITHTFTYLRIYIYIYI